MEPEAAGSRQDVVLLVDDEELVREILSMTLRRNGYTVIEAGDGQRALELCQASDAAIQLVISDVVMPRMSGPELAARLAQSRPGIKILFVSGYADWATMRQGGLRSDAAYLQKPFGPEALL